MNNTQKMLQNFDKTTAAYEMSVLDLQGSGGAE